jgi:MFS family permease
VRSLWRTIRSLPGWLQALLIGQFVNAAGALAWIYLTLYLVDSRHLSSGHAGLLSAANGVGLIAGNLVGGAIGDRIGMRRALLIGLIGWAAGSAVVPVTPVAALFPLLAASGTLAGFARPLISAVVMIALPADQRRAGAAVWRVAFNAGAIIGPPFGGLVAAHHFGVIFVFDAVSSVVLAAVVWRFAPRDAQRRPRHERAAAAPLRRTLRGNPFAVAVLATVVIVDTSYRQLYVGLPLELHHLDAPTLVYGLTVTLNGALIVLAEVWVALRMAHRSPAAVIATGYALVGASWLLFGAHPAIGTAVAMVVVISVGEMLYKPTATAAVADAAPAGYEGRYQSLYAGASISGTVLAPAIGGIAYQHHPGLLWLGAGVGPVLAAVALCLVPARPVTDQAGDTIAAARDSVGDLGGA